MSQARATFRFVTRAILAVMLLLVAGVYYMTFTQPGELTRLLTSNQGIGVFSRDAGFATVAPEAAGTGPAPASRLTGIGQRTRADLVRQAAEEEARKARKKQALAAEKKQKVTKGQTLYAPPTAQRKTVRVGD